MTTNIRIKRIERLWNDGRPMCDHAFSLIIDGQMVQDDPACLCGGERVTLIATRTGEQQDNRDFVTEAQQKTS